MFSDFCHWHQPLSESAINHLSGNYKNDVLQKKKANNSVEIDNCKFNKAEHLRQAAGHYSNRAGQSY